jgi:hypothetical protein
MPLLPLDTWADVFRPWQGKRAQYVPVTGTNVGDRLIDAAARQLMEYFGLLDHGGDPEVYLCAGGGNLGNRWWPQCAAERAAVLDQARGRPVVVLPQTYTGGDQEPRHAVVWVRERISLAAWPCSRLAPDLALAYTPQQPLPAATVPEGVFLRHDCQPDPWASRDQGDPVGLASTAGEYVLAASRFETIVTNRLHFAIAGLLAGRKVTLIAGPYWKNRAVWEESLGALGCDWAG